MIRVILDNLDIFILVFLLANKKKTTTFEIAKSNKWIDKPRIEDNRQMNIFLSNKANLIKLRLKRMSEEGIIRIDKESKNKNVYVLLPDKVLICKRYLPDDKLHKCLYFQGKDSKWIMAQID